MRTKIIFLFISHFICIQAKGQVRIIEGRVINENFENIPGAGVKINDSIVVGKTGINGKFKIEIPAKTEQLIIYSFGKQELQIKLKDACDTLEIIMLNINSCYRGYSSRKIDRLEKKRFDKLPVLYLQAYDKGLFIKKQPCYRREYVSAKPELDRIKKETINIQKRFKTNYSKLKIGDTIRVPFDGNYRSDGTNTTKLLYYSAFVNQQKFACIIKATIVGKNRRKRGYNITYKVIDCDKCECTRPLVYMEKTVDVNGIFEINIEFNKMLTD